MALSLGPVWVGLLLSFRLRSSIGWTLVHLHLSFLNKYYYNFVKNLILQLVLSFQWRCLGFRFSAPNYQFFFYFKKTILIFNRNIGDIWFYIMYVIIGIVIFYLLILFHFEYMKKKLNVLGQNGQILLFTKIYINLSLFQKYVRIYYFLGPQVWETRVLYDTQIP